MQIKKLSFQFQPYKTPLRIVNATPFMSSNEELQRMLVKIEDEIQRMATVYDTLTRILPASDTLLLPAVADTVAGLLQLRNDTLLMQARLLEIKAMKERGSMFSDMLIKASTFRDPQRAEMYIKVYVLPWKNYLLQHYYPLTYNALPEYLPNNWNMHEKSILLMELSEALRLDREALSSR